MAVVAGVFAIAGWRNLPPLEDPSAGAAGLVLGGLVVLAYRLGRRSVSAEAVATAVASARAESAAAAHAGAQAASNVIVNVGAGAAAVAAAEFGSPSWLGEVRPDVEQLDGSDAVLSITDEREDLCESFDVGVSSDVSEPRREK